MAIWLNNQDDVMRWAEKYRGPKFHALLSDPPYEIGFMGHGFDKTGVSFRSETWAALAEHLLPGGFGFAFASSRGWHRLAVAIEDAGLVIHPTVYGWGFATGSPKGARIDDDNFTGHRYGQQAIKPAVEPVICFQKPFEASPALSIIESGAGAFHIQGNRSGWERTGRLPSNLILAHLPECVLAGTKKIKNHSGSFEEAGPRRNSVYGEQRQARTKWQAYGDADGYEIVPDWICAVGCAVASIERDNENIARFFVTVDWSYEIAERLCSADPIVYCPKADRRERDAGLDGLPTRTFKRVNSGGLENDPKWAPRQVKNIHPTVKPIGLVKHLASLLLPPAAYSPRRLAVPFSGAGSEMTGAMLSGWDEITGIEMNAEYIEIAEARLKFWSRPDALKRYQEIRVPKQKDEEMNLFTAVNE